MAPHHLHASPQPLETLGEIEAEAVEMIDQEDAGLHRAASADASAIRTADALRRVSSASRIGSESCTTPAPARTHACPSRTTRSEEHTSELQSLMRISYAAYCLKTKQSKHTM